MNAKKETRHGKVPVGHIECGRHQFFQFFTGEIELLLFRFQGSKFLERVEGQDATIYRCLYDVFQTLDMSDGTAGLHPLVEVKSNDSMNDSSTLYRNIGHFVFVRNVSGDMVIGVPVLVETVFFPVHAHTQGVFLIVLPE